MQQVTYLGSRPFFREITWFIIQTQHTLENLMCYAASWCRCCSCNTFKRLEHSDKIRNLDLVSAWDRSSSQNVRHGVLREDRMVISMLLLLNIDPKLSSIYLMAQTLWLSGLWCMLKKNRLHFDSFDEHENLIKTLRSGPP